jgi:anti-sigma regulatory factor (Ser/Thr protein kinase)
MRRAEQVWLPFLPTAAGTARHELTTYLHAQRVPQPVIDDALLVISELVTNAVRHATPRDDGGLGVSWVLDDGGDLVLAVEDGGSSRVPQVAAADTWDDGGRGLSIVSVLTRRWWLERRGAAVRVSALLHAG